MGFSLSFDFGDSLRQPAECIIKVDGEELVELYPFLSEAEVKLRRGEPAECTLVFDTIRDETGKWNVQDSGLLGTWKPIEIHAAFGERSEEIMRGYIVQESADYPENMAEALLTVRAVDESIQLDREHITRLWSTEEAPLSDGGVAAQIASDFNLAAVAEDGITHNNLSQDDTSYRFIKERAEANGFEFLIRAGELIFSPPDLGSEPQPHIMVYAGRGTNCNRFSVENDGHQPDAVMVDRASEEGTGTEQETLESDLDLLGPDDAAAESRGLGSFVWKMPRPQGSTQDEARARAQGRANENAWKIRATGELDGTLYGHVLLSHRLVGVDGVGEVHSGTYYVDEVTHRFNANGYRQEFVLLRNATGDNLAPGGSSPLAGVL